jgi:hypothetical protein
MVTMAIVFMAALSFFVSIPNSKFFFVPSWVMRFDVCSVCQFLGDITGEEELGVTKFCSASMRLSFDIALARKPCIIV